MNIIETLLKTFEFNNIMYTLSMHVTAFGKLCICYREMLGDRKILCSVCVEPENKPTPIENTIGTINEYVGNARTLNDAANMLKEYVKRTYLIKKKPENIWDYLDTLEKSSDKWSYAMNLAQKFHNEGKNPDENLDYIIKTTEKDCK